MKNIITLLFIACISLTSYAQNNSELFDAVKLDSYEEVINLIAKGVNVNATDENGASVLMWAIFKSDLNMVKLLVRHGANVTKKGVIYLDDSKTGYYGSPLCIAAGEGKLDIVKYLHEECKIPIDDREFNPSDSKESGWTALQWACSNTNLYGFSDFDFLKNETGDFIKNNNEIISCLLQNGANINQNESGDKNTPLLLAMVNQKWELVDLLLKYKPDIQLKNKDGNSALHYAAMYSKWNLILDFLKQKDDPNKQNDTGNTSMMYCVSNPETNNQSKIITLRLLYTCGAKTDLTNSDGKSAISIANQNGDKEVIEYLQNPSFDYVMLFLMDKDDEAIEYTKSDKFIPNKRYVQNYSFLDVASLRNDTTLMKDLISKGEKFDVPGNNGYSSLMSAVQFGSIDAIKLLIRLGANVNYQVATDEFKTKGAAALHVAACLGKPEAIKVLIENNANINIVDDNRETPIMYAVQENNIDCFKLLLHYHVDLDIVNKAGKTVLDIAKEKNNFRIIKLLTEKKLTDTDLVEMGIYSEKEVVKLISKKNVFDINGKCDDGLTILHVAVLKKMDYLVEYILDKNLVVATVCDDSGFTPLHYAARDGFLYIAKLLIEHGADINNKINGHELDGWTPLMLAAYNNQADIFKLLLCHNVDVNIKNNEGKSALDIAKFQKAKYIIDFLNKSELTLFDFVSLYYVKEVIDQIQSKSIDVNIKDVNSNTLMYWILSYLSIYYNYYKENFDESNASIYKKLIEDEMEKSIYTVTISEGDYPAYNKGLRGTYYVLQYNDFEINSEKELLSYYDKVTVQPKTLVLSKDGKIESYTFDNGKMGMQINAQSISLNDKQKIIVDYKNWKQSNK